MFNWLYLQGGRRGQNNPELGGHFINKNILHGSRHQHFISVIWFMWLQAWFKLTLKLFCKKKYENTSILSILSWHCDDNGKFKFIFHGRQENLLFYIINTTALSWWLRLVASSAWICIRISEYRISTRTVIILNIFSYATLGMDESFHPTFHNGCNHLSMLGLKLNHVSKKGHIWRQMESSIVVIAASSNWLSTFRCQAIAGTMNQC